jgi:hypothetical protein
MRTTKELRDKIEQAARASGRSLVQEVEFRLERSFQREDQEEMIRRAAQESAQEAVKSTAGAAVELAFSKLVILPQQPPGKPQLPDEELSHPSADKEEKSK